MLQDLAVVARRSVGAGWRAKEDVCGESMRIGTSDFGGLLMPPYVRSRDLKHAYLPSRDSNHTYVVVTHHCPGSEVMAEALLVTEDLSGN